MTGAWRLAFRNLRRHRRRNVVTGLAIAVGYAGLVVLFGYAGWAERLMRVASVYGQHRGHLAVYAPGGLKRAEAKPSRFALAPEVQERIVGALRADPRVEYVGRYLRGSGLAGNGCKSFELRAVGIEPEVERRIASQPDLIALLGRDGALVAGRSLFDAPEVDAPIVLAPVLAHALDKERFASPPPPAPPPSAVQPVAVAVAVAGQEPVAPRGEAMGAGPGAAGVPGAAVDCAAPDLPARLAADPFIQLGGRTVDGSFGAVDAQVVGIFRPASTEESKTAALARLELLQRLYDTDRVTYVAAYLRDHRETAAVERALLTRLRGEGVEVSVHRFDDGAANPYYVGSMTFLRAMIFFIVVLVTNVVAFSVLNAMTLAALERTREMGTLRSLGFTRGELRALFLREASLLTALAIAAGVVLAAGARALVAAAQVRYVPPGSGSEVVLQLLPSPAAYAGTAVFFVFLGVSTTWVAVRRKAREPVAALLAEVAA